MYNHGGVLGAGGALGSTAGAGATLPFTGFNTIWLLLAAFALISAGSAILRVVPKREA